MIKLKKINLQLFAILFLAIALIVGIGIFYACTKDKNIVKNLQKETEFIAKINNNECVNVQVFRDENDNVQIATTSIVAVSEVPIGVTVPEVLSATLKQAKSSDNSIEFDVPNNGIYWLVPLDGTTPIKFEPVKQVKTSKIAVASQGQIKVICKCISSRSGCSGESKCKDPQTLKNSDGSMTIICNPILTSCCVECKPETTVVTSSLNSTYIVSSSSYFVQSNIISVNGITYQ
jgi:hypothetical protein